MSRSCCDVLPDLVGCRFATPGSGQLVRICPVHRTGCAHWFSRCTRAVLLVHVQKPNSLDWLGPVLRRSQVSHTAVAVPLWRTLPSSCVAVGRLRQQGHRATCLRKPRRLITRWTYEHVDHPIPARPIVTSLTCTVMLTMTTRRRTTCESPNGVRSKGRTGAPWPEINLVLENETFTGTLVRVVRGGQRRRPRWHLRGPNTPEPTGSRGPGRGSDTTPCWQRRPHRGRAPPQVEGKRGREAFHKMDAPSPGDHAAAAKCVREPRNSGSSWN